MSSSLGVEPGTNRMGSVGVSWTHEFNWRIGCSEVSWYLPSVYGVSGESGFVSVYWIDVYLRTWYTRMNRVV